MHSKLAVHANGRQAHDAFNVFPVLGPQKSTQQQGTAVGPWGRQKKCPLVNPYRLVCLRGWSAGRGPWAVFSFSVDPAVGASP